MAVNTYFETARDNEQIFRNILRDLKNNRKKRPMGVYIPKDLETEATLEDIFKKYPPEAFARFSIFAFEIAKDKNSTFATIYFRNIAALSGGGAGLKYSVNGDKISFLGAEMTMMS